MRNKIQKNMLFRICATMIVTFCLLTTIFYIRNLDDMKMEVKEEANYIQTAVEIAGLEYLSNMDAAEVSTRLTLINEEGLVLYDSKEEEYKFENHLLREEVKQAFQTGSGEAFRTSETIGKMTYYYAFRLDDDLVLRASKTTDALITSMLKVAPYMLGAAIVMIVLAYFFAKWQTKRLIAPINALDLSHPLNNEVYEELKPLLISLDDQNRSKEEVANMRKEFSANVSHELKTPLTSISGYAEIMKSGMVKNEDMIAFSERIYNEASRMITLIGDIIKLSKLDEKDIAVERENVDLYELANEICSRLSLLANQKNVKLELSGDTTVCWGVRNILDEMIYNLCENAIKYNVEGGKVSVWVGHTPQGNKIVFEDTGIGIPKDQQERIFERFYRVDKSHSRETGGTGLGLAIVKHAAVFHHAQIVVESEVGKGTKMEVIF